MSFRFNSNFRVSPKATTGRSFPGPTSPGPNGHATKELLRGFSCLPLHPLLPLVAPSLAPRC